jgi:hypothetical protein
VALLDAYAQRKTLIQIKFTEKAAYANSVPLTARRLQAHNIRAGSSMGSPRSLLNIVKRALP